MCTDREPLRDRQLRQIGEVAAGTGLSVKTIRHYDEVGLVVPSARSPGGFRLYTGADVERLLAIRRMKPLGFTLDEMRGLLDALDTLNNPAAGTADRERARAHTDHCHDRARDACVKLTQQLAYAHELVDQLAQFREPPLP